MANRVLLNSSALKVSQPGVNVLSATNAQLLFSSDWAGMGLYQSGTINVTSGTWSGSGNTRTITQNISLNKTFPSPPLCAFYIVIGATMNPVGWGSGALFGWIRGNDACLAHFQVTTTQIQFRAMFDKQYTPSLAVPVFSIRYYVFDYNT